jgi:hypothetical protein
VFELSPPSTCSSAWVETILYNFTGQGDGVSPQASLLMDSTGALYGTTSGGYSYSGGSEHGGNNSHNKGTVFKLTH